MYYNKKVQTFNHFHIIPSVDGRHVVYFTSSLLDYFVVITHEKIFKFRQMYVHSFSDHELIFMCNDI